MLRIQSPLPEDLELIVERTIGCCINVHRELGPGLLEAIYARAVCLELEACGIGFEQEKRIPVFYRGKLLSHHRLDVVVENQIILEIKCAERLHPVHHAQLLSYLKLSGLRAGLLMNFNAAVLRDGLKRIVL